MEVDRLKAPARNALAYTSQTIKDLQAIGGGGFSGGASGGGAPPPPY
jgi:uncharacterized membrane protein